MSASLAVSKMSVLVALVTLVGCTHEKKCCSVHCKELQPTATVASQSAEVQLAPPIDVGSSAMYNDALKAGLRETFVEDVPPAAYQLRFRLIPGSADGAVKPFYISETEVPWDVADIYIFKLDETDAAASGSAQGGGSANADAVTRPTKPYLPPDRGFGHEGYAAITMSFHNAKEFCNWLTKRSTTGRTFRLPTEAEWERACGGDVDATQLGEFAWFSDNANDSPQPIGKKKANKFGLYDMLGNVQEWCVGPEGTGVTRGGSYRNGPDKVNSTHREPANRAWNASDPQVPKSKWWLADGPFVGFRVVCEAGQGTN